MRVVRGFGWGRLAAAALLVPVVLATSGCTGPAEPPGGPQVSATAGGSGDASGSDQAVAGRVADPVTSAADLVGVWRARQIDGADVTGARDRDGNPLTVTITAQRDGWRWAANGDCATVTGRVDVTPVGRFRADGGEMPAVGCLNGTLLYPRNPQVLQEADRAELTPWGSLPGRRLTLLRDGEVVAVYAEVLRSPGQM